MSEGIEAILSTLNSEVAPQLIKSLSEISEIRKSVHAGSMEDTPVDLHTQLVFNRAAIERLEVLVGQLTLLKARTDDILSKRKAAYDDAYMKAATKPSLSLGDFSTAKEKDAHFNLAATEEMFAMRKAEAFHRDVYAAWDFARIYLRGAEQTQRDIDTRIRLITITHSLER